MRDKYFYEVMFDDTSIDVSKEVGLVWSIANSLRGAYTSDKYKDVIIPMVIIRRFECALEATKDAVVAKHKQNPNLPAALLCQVSKYPFYNTNEFTLKRLMSNATTIEVIYSYSLKDILLPVIPADEQEKIYGYLSKKCIAIDGIISEKQKALATIIQHKKSLIYEYVIGKKRVKEVR